MTIHRRNLLTLLASGVVLPAIAQSSAANGAAMKKDLASGVAPYTQQAEQVGMAWTGWAWDVKFGDFLNSGHLDVVQADGFIKGTINRWPWLQEMAMTNDDLFSNPANWPLVQPGDDLAGHQCVAFYAYSPNGQYANISRRLGLCAPIPTRVSEVCRQPSCSTAAESRTLEMISGPS